jgi:hypothetical protein
MSDASFVDDLESFDAWLEREGVAEALDAWFFQIAANMERIFGQGAKLREGAQARALTEWAEFVYFNFVQPERDPAE